MTKPSLPAEPYGHIHIGGSLYKQAQASINGSGTRNPLWLQPYGYLAKRRPSARHTYQAKQSWQISSLPVLYYKKWNDIPTLPKYVLYRTRRCGLILPFIINQIKRAFALASDLQVRDRIKGYSTRHGCKHDIVLPRQDTDRSDPSQSRNLA